MSIQSEYDRITSAVASQGTLMAQIESELKGKAGSSAVCSGTIAHVGGGTLSVHVPTSNGISETVNSTIADVLCGCFVIVDTAGATYTTAAITSGAELFGSYTTDTTTIMIYRITASAGGTFGIYLQG